MTKEELDQKIAALEGAAASLDFDQRTDLRTLQNHLDGMALNDIAGKLATMQLPDIKELDSKIAAAKQATADRGKAVAAFNAALSIIGSALKIGAGSI
jgi:hypothetical protein